MLDNFPSVQSWVEINKIQTVIFPCVYLKIYCYKLPPFESQIWGTHAKHGKLSLVLEMKKSVWLAFISVLRTIPSIWWNSRTPDLIIYCLLVLWVAKCGSERQTDKQTKIQFVCFPLLLFPVCQLIVGHYVMQMQAFLSVFCDWTSWLKRMDCLWSLHIG